MTRLMREQSSLADDSIPYGHGTLRTSLTGIGTSFSSTNLLTVPTGYVALIDQLVLKAITNDAASNHSVVVEINDQELTFHASGTANARRVERLVWNTKGNLIVKAGETLRCKSPTYAAGNGSTTFEQNWSVSGRYRLVTESLANTLGYFAGGTQPMVASTNSVTGSGTTAATEKQIIAPLAGHYVEILGFTCTGHNFNSAEDSSLLAFWDGTTGTFGNDAVKIFRAYHRGAPGVNQARVMVGDTKGCIQGPVGYGVYILQTTNVAGSTPKADFNVIYRYRKTTECANNTGASITNGGKKWWRYMEGVTGIATTGAWTSFFGSGIPTCTARIRGQAISLTGADNYSFDGEAGIVLGTAGGIATGSNFGEVFLANGDGGAGATAYSTATEDVLVCSTAQDPGFLAIAVSSGSMTARSHLVWGTMHGGVEQALTTSGGGTTIRDTWTA